ncbi:MAG TPA: exodeoxyribonuclease VII large subunit [Bryobacteraceae bacterium]|nr:exodeoxyribonuclease VII large subunit [Bryobacteraceae bacterium]
MEQFALQFIPERRIYSVSELNSAIRGVLDREFSDVWVAGEISGTKLAASGHCYFTLKERDAQLRCVCFRSTHRYLKFKPQDGIAVVARGRIDVFEQRGEYQLLVEFLEPQGHGALQFAFEELKKKLAAEGLFDAARKRPLPRFPGRIGIVTSPRGAVIRDLLNILERRFPGLHIRLYPAQVQGETAIEEVCRGMDYFNRSGWAEVVIVARGGGSLEDLWTFNEEAVARAIAASPVPVVSAIGHETDFTIADFVADLRAPTPSAAAELVVPIRDDLIDRIGGRGRQLTQAVRYRLAMSRRALEQQGVQRALTVFHRSIGRRLQRVDEQEYRLRERVRELREAAARRHRSLESRLRDYDPRPRFARHHRRLEAARASIAQTVRLDLAGRRSRLESCAAKLSQLSPLRILERGYAIVTSESGQIVTSSREAPAGSMVNVRLAEGGLEARVTKSG